MSQRHKSTEVRQQQIIDAARILIIKYGSEHVTVRRIAQEVGFSEGAVYRHFKSKKDILSLLADHIEEALLQDLSASKAAGASSIETLDRVLRSHLSAIEQRRGVSFQVIAEIISLGDKKLNKRISGAIGNYISRLQQLLEEGIKAREIKADIDPHAAATLVFGMIQGLVNIWALSNYGFNPENEYRRMWIILKEAITAPRATVIR